MRIVVVSLLAVGLLQGGCARPVQPAVFGEFSVTRSGGVAGVHDQLRVSPDGLAVELSPDLRVGRLSADRTEHARRLLESDALAREARAARRDDDDGCVDTFVTGVQMGAFSMADPGSCGTGRRRATPAFDELLTVVSDARRGVFDEPLEPGDVLATKVRVTQPGSSSREAFRIDLDQDGTATLRRGGAAPERADLDDDQRKGVGIVAHGLLGVTPTACTQASSAVIEVEGPDGRRVGGSACGFGARRVDAYAVVDELSRLFDLS